MTFGDKLPLRGKGREEEEGSEKRKGEERWETVVKRNAPGQQLAFLQLRISHTRLCAVTICAICFQVNTSGVGVS